MTSSSVCHFCCKMVKIQKEPAFPVIWKSRLCVLRLAHLLLAIFSCITSIFVSFLHFGQYSGKLNITVSAYTLVRVLLSQIGQRIQREVIFSLSISNLIIRLKLCMMCLASKPVD